MKLVILLTLFVSVLWRNVYADDTVSLFYFYTDVMYY